jgi:hypothetical protein
MRNVPPGIQTIPLSGGVRQILGSGDVCVHKVWPAIIFVSSLTARLYARALAAQL